MNAKWMFGSAGLLACFVSIGMARPHGGPDKEHHAMMQKIDADKDGKITRDEFNKTDVFALMDRNGDGVLSPEDHPRPEKNKVPKHLLRLADQDNNRTVTAQEWTAFLEDIDPAGKGMVDKDAVRVIADERLGKDRKGGKKFEGPEGPDADRPEPPPLSIAELNEAFKKMDKNGDGTIQEDELPRKKDGRHGKERGHHKGHDSEN